MDILTTPATLNMDILTTPATLRVVLKCFSDKLWERIESRDGDLKFRFDMAVKDLLVLIRKKIARVLIIVMKVKIRRKMKLMKK